MIPKLARRVARRQFDIVFAQTYHDLRMRTCPECGEPIGRESEDCPHCGANFSPTESETPGITDAETDSTKYFMAAGIILLGLWALAWFVIPWHFSGRQDEAQVIVRDALASVQTGLGAYESANDTYPASLSSLGDTAIVAVKKARSAHYKLHYTPGTAGPDGRIHSYSLTSRSNISGYVNYYTDQSTIFRSTTQNRDATAADPPIKPPS